MSNKQSGKPARKIETMAISSDEVGAITLRGTYGGAICWHYRCVSIERGIAVHELVEPRSFVNPNGTRSHTYEVVP